MRPVDEARLLFIIKDQLRDALHQLIGDEKQLQKQGNCCTAGFPGGGVRTGVASAVVLRVMRGVLLAVFEGIFT